MNPAILSFRSRCIREIRGFFEESGHLEVDTPLTASKVIPEATIDLMRTTLHGLDGDFGESLYLLPSPELYMKRLVAAGSGSIYQFSRCFRDREGPSRLHSHEFLMLEWYTVDADYSASLGTTEELMRRLVQKCDISPSGKTALSRPFLRMTVAEAFSDYAGIDLSACGETGALREAADRIGLGLDPGIEWSELFHLILVSAVEPELPRDRPVVLLDYPVQVACLAKKKADTPWRERWELYLNGVETANCFTEMVSPAEVKAYFESESTGRDARERTDIAFSEIYDKTHPRCSGVAMGIDRLLMVLAGAGSICEVMPFPQEAWGWKKN